MNGGEWTAVETSLTALYGKPAWGTALGMGSFLTVEFGGPPSTSDQPSESGRPSTSESD